MDSGCVSMLAAGLESIESEDAEGIRCTPQTGAIGVINNGGGYGEIEVGVRVDR